MTTSGRLKEGSATCVGAGVTVDGVEGEGGISVVAGDTGGVTTVTHPAVSTVINIRTTKIFLIEYLLLSGRPDT